MGLTAKDWIYKGAGIGQLKVAFSHVNGSEIMRFDMASIYNGGM